MSQTVTSVEGLAHVFVRRPLQQANASASAAEKSANRFQALEPVRQGVRRRFRAIGKRWQRG